MGLFFLLQLLLGSVERAGGSDSVYPSRQTWIFGRRSAAIQIFMDSNFMTMLTVVSTFAMAVSRCRRTGWSGAGRRTAQDKVSISGEKVLRVRTFSMIVIGCVGLYYLALLIAAAIAVAKPGDDGNV